MTDKNETDHATHQTSSDGSTEVSTEDKEYTESLGDGTSSTSSSSSETDYASGGDPDAADDSAEDSQ